MVIKKSLVPIALLLINQISSVLCSATLRIRLERYTTHGKDWNNKDCDGVFTGNKACDPWFNICVDSVNGDDSFSNCHYHAKYTTSHYQGKNTVNFNNNEKLAGDQVNNPLVINTESYQGLKLKVEAYDDDSPYNGDDLIDRLYYNNNPQPDKSEALATWRSVEVNGIREKTKTQLKFSLLLYCNVNFYGPSCSVYCEASDQDESGHYTCDPETGDITCRPGWETPDELCKVKINDCEENRCTNGATCVDLYKSYMCDCPPGYTGEICEVDIDECQIKPNCLNNGTCTDGLATFTCDCPSEYTGDRCQHHVCDVTEFCLNGGTCYHDQGETACLCPVQYAGIHCDVDKCQVLSCQNGGTCVEGECQCSENYIGALCDVDLCDHIRCSNNGLCLAGTCICPQGYSGRYCHVNINECDSDQCDNEATCIDGIDGYTCRCLPGYNGTYCEHVLPPTWQDQQPAESYVTDNTDDDETPRLISGIIVTLIAISVVIIIIAINIVRHKRKLKEQSSVTSPHTVVTHTSGGIEHFSNPLYVETSTVVAGAEHNEKTGLPPEFDNLAFAPPPYSLHPQSSSVNNNSTPDDPSQQSSSTADPLYATPSDLQVSTISNGLTGASNCCLDNNSRQETPTRSAAVENIYTSSPSVLAADDSNDSSSIYDHPKRRPQSQSDTDHWTPVKQLQSPDIDFSSGQLQFHNAFQQENNGFVPDDSTGSHSVSIDSNGSVNFRKTDGEDPYCSLGEVDNSVHNNGINEKLEDDDNEDMGINTSSEV